MDIKNNHEGFLKQLALLYFLREIMTNLALHDDFCMDIPETREYFACTKAEQQIPLCSKSAYSSRFLVLFPHGEIARGLWQR